MHKMFKKILYSSVDKRMRERFPEFSLEKYEKHLHRKSSDRDYALKIDDLWIFIRFVLNDKGYDRFECYIRWSNKAVFPLLRIAMWDKDSFNQDEGEVVLQHLTVNTCDFDWRIERVNLPEAKTIEEKVDEHRGLTQDEADALTIPIVEDVFAMLEEYGKPFIKKLINHHSK